jgi:hypothetical protein
LEELRAFAAALWRHAKVLITSGALAVVLLALQAWGLAVPRLVVQLAILLCPIPAAFLAWRDQRRARLASEATIAECEARFAEFTESVSRESIRRVNDQQFWVLAMAAEYGMRREPHTDVAGATAGSIWIGDTPIYHRDSRWLYDLVQSMQGSGLLEYVGGVGVQYYNIPAASERIVRVERIRGRRVGSPPGQLYDARTGQPVTIDPPF